MNLASESSLHLEVQEQLNGFKGATRRKIDDIRQVIMALEDRVNILRRARHETWELANDRLTSELDRTSTSLSDRLTGLERMVQSQRASPAAASDPHQDDQEAFTLLESRIEARFQAFTHEVDQLRDELAHSAEGSCRTKP